MCEGRLTADLSRHFINKAKITYQTFEIVSIVKCRGSLLLDKRSVKNRHDFVSNIHCCSLIRPLQKQLIINVNTVFK